MIKCLICGKEFKQLNGHLVKHNISPEEYCKKYNVKSTISDESKKLISNRTKQAMTNIDLSKNWLTDNRRRSIEEHRIRMLGNTPSNKLTNDEFINKLDKLFPNKFKLLSDYDGSSKIIKVHCNECNTDIEKTPRYLYSYGCPVCNKLNRSKRENTWNKISSEEFRNNFYNKIEDYELLSDYTGAENKITVKHNVCGYIWEVTSRQFYSNASRCPLCAKRVSHYETELVDFIKSFTNTEIITNTRSVIPPYELDIYIPEKSVAIEFNGNYWHSTQQKEKDYHYKKSCLCEEKGIRLIHIFEYEWNNSRQRPILENIIKSALGYSENKIYARKCKIVVKSSSEMKDFFNNNNIQGFRGGRFSICLEYNNEVVMAYNMGHCFFGKGKYDWEVIRGATKLGYTVVGGASRIWKYFLKTYDPKSCVYYVDYNYFNGNSLPYLGLEYITSQLGFKNFWVNEGIVKNREPGRNKEIKELEKQGLVCPIYNAGTKVYLYKRNS